MRIEPEPAMIDWGPTGVTAIVQTPRRVCMHEGCGTYLSAYNEGVHCFVHTLDLTQTAEPEAHVAHRDTMVKRASPSIGPRVIGLVPTQGVA